MKKSKGTAIASFAFGLTFWIPLVNLISGPIAIYLGIRALRNIKRYSGKYAGKIYAITGIILGIIPITTYLIGLGLCLIGYKEVCKTIGLLFLT